MAERLDKEGQVEQLLKGTAGEERRRQAVRISGVSDEIGVLVAR
jgi:hypothetical protein